MRVVLGTTFHTENVEIQREVARYLEASASQDFWLMVYDCYGTKLCDLIVQAKVVRFDAAGHVIIGTEGTGSPDQQVFAITRTLPEDAAKLVEAFSADEPAQMAWKRLPAGTFYLPREWANHTNGRPHVGPYLVDRWARGERPDTIHRWRLRVPRIMDAWLVVMVGLFVFLQYC